MRKVTEYFLLKKSFRNLNVNDIIQNDKKDFFKFHYSAVFMTESGKDSQKCLRNITYENPKISQKQRSPNIRQQTCLQNFLNLLIVRN